MYIYIYICIYTCVYIYIERERDHRCVYIYIYTVCCFRLAIEALAPAPPVRQSSEGFRPPFSELYSGGVNGAGCAGAGGVAPPHVSKKKEQQRKQQNIRIW